MKTRAKHGSYMEPAELKTILDKLWPADTILDQARHAAAFLHRHPRTVRRYLYGELPVTAEQAMLLRTLIKNHIDPLTIAIK